MIKPFCLSLIISAVFCLHFNYKHQYGFLFDDEFDPMFKECDKNKDEYIDGIEEQTCANDFIYHSVGEIRTDDSLKFFGGLKEQSPAISYFDAKMTAFWCDNNFNSQIDIDEIKCAQEDFIGMWQLQQGSGIGPLYVKAWKKCDQDGDHLISGDEFSCLIEEMSNGNEKPFCKRAKKSLEKVLTQLPEISIGDFIQTIYPCDDNKNGLIEEQELKCVEKTFKEWFQIKDSIGE